MGERPVTPDTVPGPLPTLCSRCLGPRQGCAPRHGPAPGWGTDTGAPLSPLRDCRAVQLCSPRLKPGADPGLWLRGKFPCGAGGRQTLLPVLGHPDVEVQAVFIPVGAVLGDGGLQASLTEGLGLQGPCGWQEELA